MMRTAEALRLQLSLAGLAALYLYLNLFTLSSTPFLLEGDQNFFWADADRMLQGQQPYRDFFQFTTPGTDYFFLGMFRAFGPHIWAEDLAVILLGVALCWICFGIALRIMAREWALLATVLFVVCIYGRDLDATHHWFSLLAILIAVRILLPGRAWGRVMLAGALLGVACFLTQFAGLGATLAFLAALAWAGPAAGKPWRIIIAQQSVLLVSCVVTLGVLCAPFIADVGWRRIWYLWVTYPHDYLVVTDPLFRLGFSGHGARQVIAGLATLVGRGLIYASLLLAYPLVWWHCWRRRRAGDSQGSMALMLLSLPGFFLFLEVAARPNWGRLYSVFLPALLLSFWWLSGTDGRQRRYVMATLWVLVACFGSWQIASRQRHSQEVLDLPAGRAVIADADLYEQFSWLRQHTTPGEWFLQTDWLNTYFPLRLRSPIYLDQLLPSLQTRPEDVQLAVRQLAQRRPRYILWTPRINPDYARFAGQDNLGPFRNYLLNHYSRVHVFANEDEVWEWQPSPAGVTSRTTETYSAPGQFAAIPTGRGE
jgi:hypothetical protein